MNKKGFTLAEILGIIILLAVISSVVFIAVSKVLKCSRENAYDEQINRLIEASKKWVVNNTSILPSNGDIKLNVVSLVDDGYLEDSDVENPKDSKNKLNGCIKISYLDTYNQYVYEYIDICE